MTSSEPEPPHAEPYRTASGAPRSAPEPTPAPSSEPPSGAPPGKTGSPASGAAPGGSGNAATGQDGWSGSGAGGAPEQELLGREEPRRKRRGALGRWMEKRAARVVGKVYEDRAEDLQERAAATIGSLYEERADDLEDRAVRAMRRAIEAESDRIRQAIEHGVAVKKREVRLSLLVLAVSSLVYLVLYWSTR